MVSLTFVSHTAHRSIYLHILIGQHDLKELEGSLKITILFGEFEKDSILQCKIISENGVLAKTTTSKPSKCPLWRESFVLNISNETYFEIHLVDKSKVLKKQK